MTTETFTVKNYTVNTVLDNDIIYVKVLDNTTFSVYDVECDLVNFPNADSLEDVYKLLNNCLRGEENHACLIYVKPDVLIISVSAQFSGYYKVKYALQLRERVGMEQKCNAICARLLALETKFGDKRQTTEDEVSDTITPEKIFVVRKTIDGVNYLKQKTPNENGTFDLYNPETRELVAFCGEKADKILGLYMSDSQLETLNEEKLDNVAKEVELLGNEIVANELKVLDELHDIKRTVNYLLRITDVFRKYHNTYGRRAEHHFTEMRPPTYNLPEPEPEPSAASLIS